MSSGPRESQNHSADPDGHGARTAAGGTPHPVDFSGDRRARDSWAVLLAGPVLWFTHFMVVYLVVEAGCTGGGPGLRVFDPPVPAVVTLGATALAGAAGLGLAVWTYRLWRRAERAWSSKPAGGSDAGSQDESPGSAVAFGGFLLSTLSVVTIAFVGVPAVFLPSC